ncbi:MAG: hypothetical protein AAFX65_03325 [Cyanobacteria bacterium J06638_7]
MPAPSPRPVQAPAARPALALPSIPQPQPPPPLPPEPSARRGAIAAGRSLLCRVRWLADLLVLEPVAAPDPGPYVHTAALHSTANLSASLAGITQLSREQGFSRDPETHYGDAGLSASYHVDHRDLPVSLSVSCNPLRQTVAIAVSGLDCDEAYRCFQALEAALFGDC